MKASSRWRDWQPEHEKFESVAESQVSEVSKPTSAPSATSSQGVSPNSQPQFDPEAWSDEFHEWGLAHCTFRERSFHSIRHLHTLFCDWCLSTQRVPCRYETFEALLFGEGFTFADGLIYGLVPIQRKPQIHTERKS